MKDIGRLRKLAADIFHAQHDVVVSINQRDEKLMLSKLDDIEIAVHIMQSKIRNQTET